jgi:Domain of unknown function (DUF4345)
MTGFWRFTPWLSRLILFGVSVLFSLIAFRYISDPVGATSPFKISLGTPAAVTNMRVVGAMFLGVAIISVACLISIKRHLTGLAVFVPIIVVVTAVRILGAMVDGPDHDTLQVLRPEVVLLVLSSIGLFLEFRRRTLENKQAPANR